MIQRRSLAFGAVLTLGIGVLFGTSPASAQGPGAPQGPAPAPLAQAEEAAQAFDAATGVEGSALGYGINGSGEPVVLIDKEFKDEAVVAELTGELGVEGVAVIGQVGARAQNELVGGAGLIALVEPSSALACSTGFTA